MAVAEARPGVVMVAKAEEAKAEPEALMVIEEEARRAVRKGEGEQGRGRSPRSTHSTGLLDDHIATDRRCTSSWADWQTSYIRQARSEQMPTSPRWH